jgi:diguanylate cyclase (GGDEF)-like protein
MHRFLKNISRIDLSYFRKREKALSTNFELIKSHLILPEVRLKSVEELNEYLINAFSNIANQSNITLKLYGTHRENKNNWKDIISDRSVSTLDTQYLVDNFYKIFNEQVGIHKCDIPSEKNLSFICKTFLSFRIEQEFYYIVYIDTWRNQEYYYHLFHSSLSKLLELNQEIREQHKLKLHMQTLQTHLAEKERSLQIAERAVKRKVYDLHNLVEASNEIYSILDFKQLINSALLTIIGQIGVQSAFSLMYDSTGHAFDRFFQKGFREKEIKGLKFNTESPTAQYFLNHETPVFLNELDKEARDTKFIEKLKKLKISIVAPIIHSERLQGIIAIGEKLYGRDFTQTDFELFHVLVNIISISIGNALNYEEVKNLSLTDGMTNLHNYRYFTIRLKEELNRARRNNTKVSLLILDIDHFKNYNDTLGHQAGDEALRVLGKVIKSTVRDEDVVSRYGGEEFCIILPGSSKESMKKLGERVRQQVEVHKFYKEKVQPLGRITISLGGATFPDEADNSDLLIQRSDEALYFAKNMGRNQLRLYQPLKKGKTELFSHEETSIIG